MDFDLLILKCKEPFHCTKHYRLISLVHKTNWIELRRLARIYSVSGEKVWSEGYNLLYKAIECKNSRIVQVLITLICSLSPVVERNKDLLLLQFILYYAIVSKDRLLINLLLDVGVSANELVDQETALCTAIRTKAGLDIIRLFIDRGACVSSGGKYLCTSPLGLVFGYPPSDLDVAELLFTSGADVNKIYPKTKETLVHLACDLKNNEGLIWLLNHQADPNKQTEHGETGLHLAVIRGDLSNATTLLEYGASPNILNETKQSPLTIAVENNEAEITELLLQNGAEICNTSLNKAFRNNVIGRSEGSNYSYAQHKIYFTLAKYGFVHSSSINDLEFIHAATRNGHFWIVKTFLEAGGSSNSVFCNIPLLIEAIKSQNKDVVEILLNYGSRISYKDYRGVFLSAISVSVSSNLVEITELLLSKRKNDPPQFWILLAAENLNLDMLRVLFKFGVNAHTRFKGHVSAIHTAIMSNKHVSTLIEDIDLEKSKVVRLLLQHGAKVSLQKLGQNDPIHFAISLNYVKVVKALLEAGTSFDNCVDVGGKLLPSTLLHFAIKFNSNEMVKVLLAKGASVDALQYDGKTPLELAIELHAVNAMKGLLENGASIRNKNVVFNLVERGSPAEVVAELLKFGADVNRKGCFAKTALHKACRLGRGDVVAVLLNYGADISAEDLKKRTPFIVCKKSRLAMKMVAQGNWFGYEHGEAIAGPSTPLYHLQRHAYKMDLLGLPLHTCLKPVLEFEYSKDFVRSCRKEIELMNTFSIGGSYLCVYDIIKQKHDPAYLTNQSVLLSLYSNDLWEHFPLFRGILKSCIGRAKLRLKLLDSGQKCFSDIISIRCLKFLPNEVVRKIVSNFEDEELKILLNY